MIELFTNVWGAGAHTARQWFQQVIVYVGLRDFVKKSHYFGQVPGFLYCTFFIKKHRSRNILRNKKSNFDFEV